MHDVRECIIKLNINVIVATFWRWIIEMEIFLLLFLLPSYIHVPTNSLWPFLIFVHNIYKRLRTHCFVASWFNEAKIIRNIYWDLQCLVPNILNTFMHFQFMDRHVVANNFDSVHRQTFYMTIIFRIRNVYREQHIEMMKLR